ncbi:MAG: MotA/TolQ/ExbB proton channel family protein [Chitinophagaceae bacterium]|nr:MotA/TolQ/ExbB proton channel family protein [Oligoflexus sp.]
MPRLPLSCLIAPKVGDHLTIEFGPDRNRNSAYRNLAKYPPALGMTGTVMGLVSLFSILGDNNKTALGPALALAITATFFGLILSNCFVTPLADHLHIKHMQDEKVYTGVYQILILINRNEPARLISDEVKGREAA